MENTVFKRIEKKYLISPAQYSCLMTLIGNRLIPDKWGKSTVLSIYFDTEENLIIRNSIDAKAYKEKLRLRSYGMAKENTTVFLELKKKYKGVVYKRRRYAPGRKINKKSAKADFFHLKNSIISSFFALVLP